MLKNSPDDSISVLDTIFLASFHGQIDIIKILLAHYTGHEEVSYEVASMEKNAG